MTGPRLFTVRPRHRRGRHLLPLLLAGMLSPLGCSSDQPTEPISANQPILAAKTRIHPRAKSASMQMSSARSSGQSPAVSFAVTSATPSTGPSVLILADTDVVATSALATSLADSGLQVTLRPAPEYTWDGTNPSLNGFDVVIHLDGTTYDFPLSSAAQDALTNFVRGGGGFIGARWNGYESQAEMADLTLQGMSEGEPEAMNCGGCLVTWDTLPAGVGHPVLAGLPESFEFFADAHDAGQQVVYGSQPSTVLMKVSTGGPAVIVRDFDAGRVVSFSFAPNYPFDDLGNRHEPATLQNQDVQHLYLNAVRWAAGSGSGTAQSQTITFDPLGDKTYGEATFSVNATASSNLPVSLTAAGDCSVLGTSVTIAAAGTCTITAHQAGNDDFLPAEDVSRTFSIAKAPVTLSLLGTVTMFDGAVKGVSVVTAPAGVSGVTIAYSQGGSTIPGPVNAGDYQVLVTLTNPNYVASPLIGTLTINRAMPTISWTPGPLAAGTALTSAQLNASATGIGGVPLGGGWVYTPSAGTVLTAGTHDLLVVFNPSSPNYGSMSRTVSITVSSTTMGFSGFFTPVSNMPSINPVNAGSAVPLKFTVPGYKGSQVLRGATTSTPVQCSAAAVPLGPTVVNNGSLQLAGSTYSYLWRTDARWSGSCRRFVLTLADGSTHAALFRFTPAPRAQVLKRR
jgi:hypothetical protein